MKYCDYCAASLPHTIAEKDRCDLDKVNANPRLPGDEYPWPGAQSMTLRDYFAAHAMQAFIAQEQIPFTEEDEYRIAYNSYRLSDEMLKVRDQK